MHIKKAILVIDPLVSPQYLLGRFYALGFEMVALRTLPSPSDYFSYDELPFLEIINSSNDIKKDIEVILSLTDCNLIHGFSGNEASLPYAEKILSQLFPTASNDIRLSIYRFDKFIMNEVLRQKELPAIKQKRLDAKLSVSEKVDLCYNFFKENNNNIVIKPSHGSSSSVGVFTPSTTNDIEHYFDREAYRGLFFKADIVLQEKIKGSEYYVDSVSYQGIHTIVSIARYSKKEIDGLFVYQYIDAIDLTLESSKSLQNYTLNCLNTLDVMNGFSHIEIIASETEFKLIEINMRVSGLHGWCNNIALRKYGWDQVSAYIDLLERRMPIIQKNNPQLHQRIFMFKNYRGEYHRIDLSPIINLHSYINHEILHHKMSTQAKEKESLVTLVMLILLESEDKDSVEKDTQALFKIEKQGSCLIR